MIFEVADHLVEDALAFAAFGDTCHDFEVGEGLQIVKIVVLLLFGRLGRLSRYHGFAGFVFRLLGLLGLFLFLFWCVVKIYEIIRLCYQSLHLCLVGFKFFVSLS